MKIIEQIQQTQLIILRKLTALETKIDSLNDRFTLIVDDVFYLKNEAKLIAAWQNAKKRNNMKESETWYELTKCMNEYFADQLSHQNNMIN